MSAASSSSSQPVTVETPASVRPTEAALASDTTHPSISPGRIADSAWGSRALLDIDEGNWEQWKKHMLRVLILSNGLDEYALGTIPRPSETTEPRAHRNWTRNDNLVRAYIQSKCADAEEKTIEDCVSAQDVWAALSGRHTSQGPVVQMRLIQEAFAVRYTRSTSFAHTTQKLQALNRRIWDMGTPTADDFLVILMLFALSGEEMRSVHDSVVNGISTSTRDTPFTSSKIIQRLELEQHIQRHEEEAMTVQTPAQTAVRTRPMCTNTKNCPQPIGHTQAFCIKKGGGMFGHTIEEARLLETL